MPGVTIHLLYLFQMFLNLPPHVVCCIAFEWLNVSSLCRLDSAFCSVEIRAEFLAHLSAEHYALLESPPERNFNYKFTFEREIAWKVQTSAFYSWAICRKFKVSSIEVDQDTDLKLLAKYLDISCSCLKSILFRGLQKDRMEAMISLCIVKLKFAHLQEVRCFMCELPAKLRDFLLMFADTICTLKLHGCNGNFLKCLEKIKCPRLTVLAPSCFDSDIIALMSMCDHVTHLNCAGSSSSCYFLSLPCCTSLMKVNLSCTDVRNADILQVCSNCQQLDGIELCECRFLTDEAIVALVTRCSQLRTLWMNTNDPFTDISLRAIAEHGRHLQSLNISACPLMTTAALLGALSACSSLHTYFLDESATRRTQIVQIAQHLPGTLTSLFIGAPTIPFAVLRAVGERCPLLSFLNMQHCSGAVLEQGLAAVANGCPRLCTVVVPWEDAELRAMWHALRPDVRVVTPNQQPWPDLLSCT